MHLWHLEVHEKVEHLLFETIRRNREVENGHLDTGLWRVVWVWQGSGHEEFETERVLDDTLSNLDGVVCALLGQLLEKNWLQSRVELLADVLVSSLHIRLCMLFIVYVVLLLFCAQLLGHALERGGRLKE